MKDVIEHYLGSGDFNGTPVRELEGSSTATRELIVSLVRDEVVSLNFGDRVPLFLERGHVCQVEVFNFETDIIDADQDEPTL